MHPELPSLLLSDVKEVNLYERSPSLPQQLQFFSRQESDAMLQQLLPRCFQGRSVRATHCTGQSRVPLMPQPLPRPVLVLQEFGKHLERRDQLAQQQSGMRELAQPELPTGVRARPLGKHHHRLLLPLHGRTSLRLITCQHSRHCQLNG